MSDNPDDLSHSESITVKVSRTSEQKAEEERQKEATHQYYLSELASRYVREKIYEEIWSEPIQQVAKRYKISDVGLAKVCRKLNIPRPGRGYWAVKAAGKPIPKRPPLPELALFVESGGED